MARFFCILSLAVHPLQAQGKRVALVIGNSAWEHTPDLENPRNDTADMAAKLGQVGLEVLVEHDLDKTGMDRAIRLSPALSGDSRGSQSPVPERAA